MSVKDTKPESIAPVTNVVDDAVGMPKSYWFIAIVQHRTEKTVQENLDKLGIVNYLPVQSEIRKWKNGRKAKVDRIVLPSMVFVHCTESERREIVKLPFINRFMTDKAARKGDNMVSPLAKVPDWEIRQLKFMLGQSDIPVTITSASYAKGDKVRIIRGSLKGIEGEVVNMTSTQAELHVKFDFLGCAKLSVDTVNLERIY